jgi:hypothetical protein
VTSDLFPAIIIDTRIQLSPLPTLYDKRFHRALVLPIAFSFFSLPFNKLVKVRVRQYSGTNAAVEMKQGILLKWEYIALAHIDKCIGECRSLK